MLGDAHATVREHTRGRTAKLRIASLLLLAALLMACGDRQCFADGHCVELAGDGAFWLRWLGAFGLGAIGLWAAGAALAEWNGLVTAIILFFGCGLIGLGVVTEPGCTRPSTRSEQEVTEYTEHLAERRIAQSREAELTPIRQLQAARSASKRLHERVAETLEPLREKYDAELATCRTTLASEFRKARVASRDDLLARREEYPDLEQALERAAVLEHATSWLGAKIAEAQKMARALDQSAWRLEKLVELDEVATTDERESLRRAIATAEAVLDEKVSALASAEIARREKAIFDSYAGGT
jgi:hypothetical protein